VRARPVCSQALQKCIGSLWGQALTLAAQLRGQHQLFRFLLKHPVARRYFSYLKHAFKFGVLYGTIERESKRCKSSP
jgi:hypothetical protein